MVEVLSSSRFQYQISNYLGLHSTGSTGIFLEKRRPYNSKPALLKTLVSQYEGPVIILSQYLKVKNAAGTLLIDEQ